MAQFVVTVRVEGDRLDYVQKRLKVLFGDNAPIYTVEKVKNATTRADRLGEAEAMIQDAVGVLDELAGEMSDWYDSIPENLQGGGKASEVEECKDALESLKDELENCDFGSISFPGMF